MSRNDGLKQVPDLRLALGTSAHRDLEIPRLNLVVGANAASRADMSTFVANDTLCELVWSRRNGLILRYAVCEKSPFSSSAGPSNMIHSSVRPTATENNHNKLAEERTFVQTQASSKDAALSIPLKISGGQTPTCKSGLEDGRMQKISPESSSQCKTLNQSKTLQKEDGESKMPTPSSSSLLPVDKSECSAERDLHGKEQVCLEVYEISKASPIRAFASGRKGKEKVLTESDLKTGVSQEEDDSYKSSESFNSTGICVRKKRVMSFEEKLIVGSKRLKMQIQESHGSTRSNSSFANWISTMITGLPRSDTSKRVLRSDTSNSMGFQTFFESIYQPNLKTQDERWLRSKNHSSEANNTAIVISDAGDLMAVEPNLDSNVMSWEKHQSNGRVAHHGCFGSCVVWNEERFKKFSSKVNLEIKEGSMLIRKGSSNIQKDDAPSCKHIASTLPDSSYSCRTLNRQGLDVPTGIFEAVRSLRLSRTDIMKWTNSMFFSALDGYYLRLRVGKSGQALGGASYQVACICRSEGGNLAETPKRPISVIVGGVKCLVECQYISNQDFLQDELKAWWTATLRDDGKVPSEDELRSKVEQRRRLGL